VIRFFGVAEANLVARAGAEEVAFSLFPRCSTSGKLQHYSPSMLFTFCPFNRHEKQYYRAQLIVLRLKSRMARETGALEVSGAGK